MEKLNKLRKYRYFWPILALCIILLYNLIFTPNFFKIEIMGDRLYGNLIDILHRATPIMLVAIGMTLVIATGGIDLSVGAIVSITGSVAASLIGGKLVLLADGTQNYVSNYPMGLAITIAILVGVLCGAWNGFLVSKIRIPPIIATLILMVVGRGIAQLITNGEIITVYYAPFFFIGNGYIFKIPFTIIISAVIIVLTIIFTRKTVLGLFLESVGINREASRLSGVKASIILFISYAFCGFCSAISGLIVCSNVKSADANNAGLLFEMDAILAVVIGGTSLNGGKFYIMGTVIGAIIIQTLTTTIYSTGVPPEITLVIKAIVVFIISLIQSEEFRNFVAKPFSKKGGKLYE